MRGADVAQPDEWSFFDEISDRYSEPFPEVYLAAYCEKDGCVDGKAGYATANFLEPEHNSEALLPQVMHPHTIYCAAYAAVLEILIKASDADTIRIYVASSKLIEQLTVNIRKWRSNG